MGGTVGTAIARIQSVAVAALGMVPTGGPGLRGEVVGCAGSGEGGTQLESGGGCLAIFVNSFRYRILQIHDRTVRKIGHA